MMNHEIASVPYVREILYPGTDREGRSLDELERALLDSWDLRAKVAKKLSKCSRKVTMTTAYDYDDNHLPGTLKRVRVKKPGGGYRETWSPNDHDHAQAIWRNVAFTMPLVRRVAHRNTHGFLTKRSHGTALDEVLRATATGTTVILQTDVADCFPTLAFQHLRGTILRGRLETYILRIHERYRQAVKNKGPLGQGLPAGHPSSPSLAVLALDELLRPIREEWMGDAVIVYADDISTIGPDVKRVGAILREIETALRLQGMRLNYAKTRYTDPSKGGKIELLGYEIDWSSGRATPIVRPKRHAFKRLTEKVAEAPDPPTIRRIIEGWLNAYDRSNDPDLTANMRNALSLGHLLRANR